MPRAGLNPEIVTGAAAEIVRAEGLAALTLARLAAKLRVATPSLYKHITGLDDLIERLTLLSVRRLADDLTTAAVGRSGRQALVAIADAYRGYATGHAGLYPLTQGALRTGAVALQADAARLVAVLEAVVRSYGVRDHLIIHAIRIVRSGLHGFADIEARGGLQMPESIDQSFSLLIDALDAALDHFGRVD